MKRTTFLSTMATSALGAAIVPNMISCQATSKKGLGLKNWAGNYTYKAAETKFPKSIDALKDALNGLSKAKALGTQHCFNDIADTAGTQLSTKNLNAVLELNEKESYVLVESGIKYGDLGKYLHTKGWALHNLASLPHISVGGSCATATHGSGIKNGNLATAMLGFELLTPNGEVLWVDANANADLFFAAGVSMGALGIFTKIKLAIQPTFSVSQKVYENLPMEALKENFDALMGSGYSVSLFTHWLDKNINQVWVKSRQDQTQESPTDWFGATPANTDLHPIKVNSPINCTPQMGVAGPWHERLPHFKMDFTPSNGEELQSEFFIPREKAYDAIMAVEALHSKIEPLLFVTEIRCIAADDFWMSTAFQRESVAIHFTWKPNTPGVMSLLPELESVLKPFDARPHWGKIFTLPAVELVDRYPKFDDFLKLKHKLDPKNTMQNRYLQRALAL